jgi:hypothetical protein
MVEVLVTAFTGLYAATPIVYLFLRFSEPTL